MNHIYLGQNVLTGKDIYIPIEEFGKSSTHILGKSQVGKSKESERIARDIIKSEYGLLVIDGKGDLYNGLLDFCTVLKYPPHQLALIDPTDDYCPGINFLECLNGVSPDTQAGIIIDCFKKFFGEHDETKHWLEEYGPNSLDPLSRQGFALTELFEFLLTDPSFRHAVLQQSGISSHF